jgi:hypothetical protein
MAGDIVWLVIWMWIVAVVAFAPLGYFIYMYTKKSDEPFGDTEPHGDSESKVLDVVEQIVNTIKGKLSKK